MPADRSQVVEAALAKLENRLDVIGRESLAIVARELDTLTIALRQREFLERQVVEARHKDLTELARQLEQVEAERDRLKARWLCEGDGR